jgi:hypothetical protein
MILASRSGYFTPEISVYVPIGQDAAKSLNHFDMVTNFLPGVKVRSQSLF